MAMPYTGTNLLSTCSAQTSVSMNMGRELLTCGMSVVYMYLEQSISG